jgi:hypothetical protein
LPCSFDLQWFLNIRILAALNFSDKLLLKILAHSAIFKSAENYLLPYLKELTSSVTSLTTFQTQNLNFLPISSTVAKQMIFSSQFANKKINSFTPIE